MGRVCKACDRGLLVANRREHNAADADREAFEYHRNSENVDLAARGRWPREVESLRPKDHRAGKSGGSCGGPGISESAQSRFGHCRSPENLPFVDEPAIIRRRVRPTVHNATLPVRSDKSKQSLPAIEYPELLWKSSRRLRPRWSSIHASFPATIAGQEKSVNVEEDLCR